MRKAAYIFIVLFLSVSCVYHDDRSTDGVEAEYISFLLRVPSHSAGEETRSTPAPMTRYEVPGDDALNENYIDFNGADRTDIHIFMFATNETNCILYPETERLSLSDEQSGQKKLNIQLKGVAGLADIDADNIIGRSMVMYVVANSGLQRADFVTGSGAAETVKPLAEIMRTVITAAGLNGVSGGEIVPQEKFVMEAKQAVYASGATNLATVMLKRVASKIQMGIYNAQVEGFTPVSASVKLVNYVGTGYLGNDGSGEYGGLTAADYGESGYVGVPLDTVAGTPEDAQYAQPFYSYPSDWSADASKAAFLLLKVTWRENATSGERDSYYKIPVSDIPSDTENGALFRNSLRRNCIYRYYVSLTALGGYDPEAPATVSDTNLDIESWDDDNEIYVRILKFDWLFIDQRNIALFPSGDGDYVEYFIPYRTSSPIGFAETVSAWYESFNASSNDSREIIYYGSSHYPDQIPQVTLNATDPDGNRSIRVYSKVPGNYVPKNFHMKIENQAHLFADIDGIHFPAIYVVGTRSNSSSSNNVKYIYTITTLALTGDETFDWDWWRNNWNGVQYRNKTYTIGNAFIKNADGTFTFKDEPANAWVVSPKFIVQSSLTYASGTMNLANSRSRCNSFSENGLTGWRLPTIAELYLIYKLQNEGKSAINGALAPATFARRAWSAGTYLLNGDRAYNVSGNLLTGSVSVDSSSFTGAVFNMDSTPWSFLSNTWLPASGTGAYSTLGSYVHVPVCVRDVYQ